MNVRTPYQGFPPSPAAPNAGGPAEPTPREKIARLKTLARRALRYWKLTFLILVLGCVGSLVMAMNVQLIYKSETTVLYKSAMRTTGEDEGPSPERTRQIGAKLKDLLTTHESLEKLIDEFKLYPKIVDKKGIVEAVEEMRLHIGFRARDSQTFVISFENEKPEVAKQVTARLADAMIDNFTNSASQRAQQQASFLVKQEERSAGELENATKALATFLTSHPEFAVETKTAFGPGGGPADQPHLPTQNVPKGLPPGASSDPQLAVLYRQKLRLEEELRNNAGAAPTPAAPLVTGGESIAKLTQLRDEAAKSAAAATMDLADKRTRLTDEHPDVISAKLTADAAARRLHQAEQSLAAAKAAQNAGGVNPYETSGAGGDAVVQKRISQLNAEIAARQDALRRNPPQPQATGDGSVAPAVSAPAETNELVDLETEWQRKLNGLHDARVAHDALKLELEKAQLSASAVEATGGDRMTVIDPAYKPTTPTKGGRTKTALAGGAVTLILALAYAFLRVLTNDTLIDSADIDAIHVIPVLGVIPKVRVAPPSEALAPEPGKEPHRVV